MRLPIYQVDAFAQQPFAGNPAAVVPLEAWLPDALMQQIAAENNLAETAFFVPHPGPEADFHLRWFTPTFEIDLCGHATLATAHVLWHERGFAGPQIVFHSQSGPLRVSRAAPHGPATESAAAAENSLLTLDFPSRPPRPLAPADHPVALLPALGPGAPAPQAVLAARDLVAVFATADEILALRPDFAALLDLGYLGLIATAPGPPGSGTDFISRFFAPEVGVPEDPVTGSAHSTLIPYWAARLGKTTLFARQESARGGSLWCRLRDGDRVDIGGHAVTFLRGEIDVPQ